jgi:DNA-directed RNA polymerase alpha subunit
MKEPIESQPIDNYINLDTQDLLKTSTNFRETINNIFEKLEQQGLDIGKQYKWDKRIYKVSR